MSDELSGIAHSKKGASDRRPSTSSRRPSTSSKLPPTPPPILRESSIRGKTDKNKRDTTDASVSFSITTMESAMTRGAKAKAQKDLIDEVSHDGTKQPSQSWFCYRLILAGLLAVIVSIICFMISCQSFKYESWDDGVFYYGIRGVTDRTTGRCVGWELQELIDWNVKWTHERLPALFILGIIGIVLVVVTALAWIAYGVILKKNRNRHKIRVDPSHKSTSCFGPSGPAVIIGVCLILSGLLIFVTIMGNCSNIQNISHGDLGCNLHTWSELALASTIALFTMGGALACFLKCCCYNGITRYMLKEVIDH